jgi:uncharacterized protein (DUF1810 family)
VSADPFGLQRFVAAQDAGDTFGRAAAELTRGRKTSHWMWFVFPQLAGLGSSEMSRRYAIASIAEAQAYLAHPVLGPRLREVTDIVAGLHNVSAVTVFGGIDAQKLQSSMTLFLAAAPDEHRFSSVLDHFYAGQPDPATRKLLRDHHEGTP